MASFPQLHTEPAMDSGCIIQGDCWRIGVITDSLIRLEWQDDGCFEDCATQTVVNRHWLSDGNKPRFTQTVRDGQLVIETAGLHLTYDMQPFSKEGLHITVKGAGLTSHNTWHYGDRQEGNLMGTARTLDAVNGATSLGTGVLSRYGWAVLDDSATNEIVETAEVNGEPNSFGAWVKPRAHAGKDLYFFGYGHRYIEAIQDFYALTGPTPLLPRFALGNWWSRYHRYTEREYIDLIERFEKEDLPFTTAVIDMDWHLVDDVDSKYGSGWTGYTWNRKLFPDPERFLAALHSHGLKTSPNVHPRDGIRAFEDGYEKAARHIGIDPKSGDPVEFDLTSPRFMEAYFNMHHDLEAQGVDFWWLDWQQGGVTRQKGLDPLWMLNHMHYLDSAREGRWPLTFSRYAGPGSHRYPVGFSGDSIVTWESLKFQPYFTATASNIGYGWWSHDIGGHMYGYRDEELEARWYQLGTFSPINRLHSTDSPFNGKEPWNFHDNVRQAMNAALRLRHQLLPYLYTMNWRASLEGRPLVEPMYWQSPEIETAYEMPDEFRFGTELVVAPITEPMDKTVQMGKADVWLPQGVWFDFFTGRKYTVNSGNGRKFEVWRGLEGTPVFARAGAIVPMQPLDEANGELNSIKNPKHLRVMVFPGARGTFDLVEDDGRFRDVNGSLDCTDGSDGIDGDATENAIQNATTTLVLDWDESVPTTFTISPVVGLADAVPERRSWTVVFRGAANAEVGVQVDGTAVETNASYDESTLSLTVEIPDVSVSQAITVTVTKGLDMNCDCGMKDAFQVLYDAQIHYRAKEEASRLIASDGARALTALPTIGDAGSDERPNGDGQDNPHIPMPVIRALAECLLR